LYVRHTDVAAQLHEFKKGSPSCLIEHGMNPGLLSHFVSQGLVHIAEKIIKEKPEEGPLSPFSEIRFFRFCYFLLY